MRIDDFLDAIKGYGGYTTSAILLGIYWKGLPPVVRVISDYLDSWAKRRDGFEARVNGQLAAADKRHEEAEERHKECLEGQVVLRNEIAGIRQDHETERREWHAEMDRVYNQLSAMRNDHNDAADKWREEAAGYKRQLMAYQQASEHLIPILTPEAAKAAPRARSIRGVAKPQ